jgi:general secretion pathway protein A
LNGLKERGEILAVFIDEAQRLSGEVIKELLSLFEWESWIPEVFQLVLVGQPELDTLLDDALMRYRPKVPGLRVKISPLSEKESLEYIAHRLRIAGSSSSAVFSPQALSLIAKHARGIPRVINIVCDNAFLAGYSGSLKRIEVGVIREIIGNLDGPGVKRKMRGRIFGAKASYRPLSLRTSRFGLIVLAGLAVGVFLYLAGLDLANRVIPSKGPGEIKKSAERMEPPSELSPYPQAAPTEKREGLTATADTDTNATQVGSQEGGDSRSGESIFRTIKVTRGQTLSKLAIHYYGKSNESLVDLILTRNPSITDADLILVDQEIHLPELKEETLLAQATDKTIRVHLGTFSRLNKATLFKNSLTLRGNEIDVKHKKVSPRVTWYRVEATHYRTEKEALADIKMLRGKRLLPFF